MLKFANQLLVTEHLNIIVRVEHYFNPLSANPEKWSNTLKQFVGNLATNCLSVFDYFVGLALEGLKVNSGLISGSTVIYDGNEV